MKNVLTIIMCIVLVLMLVIDLFFYQQQAMKAPMIILGIMGTVASLMMMDIDEKDES